MLTRRRFVVGTAAIAGTAGALVIGWSATPARQRIVPSDPLPVAPGQVAMNGWVKVSPDNTVTIMMAAAEMGQGVFTGLAMLLADEMDADWSSVKLEQAGSDGIYNNQAAIVDNLPLGHPDENGLAKRATQHVLGKVLREIPGLWGTGGSSSIRDQWLPLRQAGASARAMLIAAAAEEWGVPVAECRADTGRVLHASGKSASFGELASNAAKLPQPASIALKQPSEFKLIGKPVRRIDNAAKLDGSAVFAIDVLPEGLLYASMSLCPTLGGKVARFDAAAALASPGVRKVVALDPVAGGFGGVGTTSGGVAVIADTPYHAMRAVEKLTIEWDHGPAAGLSSEAITRDFRAALDANPGKVHFESGDANTAFGQAAKIIEAEYHAPFLAHAPMEPLNATVQFKDGAATVWVGTQFPGFSRGAAASALDIAQDKVDVRLTYLGGSFGRRGLTDFVWQTARLARETDGAPVQLIWSREQDTAHDYYRPAAVSRAKGGFDKSGRLIAWQTTSAGSSMGAPSFLDGATTEGASTTASAFPNARIAHVSVEHPVTTSFWRSVGHSQNAFFTESFVDECASAAGQDPVEFRAALLAANERHLRVLHRAAELSKWGQPPDARPDGEKRARGIAVHRSFGSIVAQVAEVSVSAAKEIRVHRVVCVIDCGFAVNPNLVRQQMESGIVYGLSAALRGEITIANGQVQQSNFHDYAPLRIDECPEIETEIIASDERPGGVGEPGTPPIAPAVANAVFALTGERLRTLPLKLA
jgi:isoquinoline 1-oxidoreductase subunit beta